MPLPRLNPEVRDWLVRTMVEIAHIDGRVAPVEGALVERVMALYGTDDAEKELVKRQLRGKAPLTPPGKAPADMSYDDKLECFREVVELVFADGVLHRAEEAAVMKLANALSLHPGDMQPIWNRAKRQWDGRRSHDD